MRDLIIFAIVFGVLPFAFVRPYYGLLLFSWLAYMRAPDLAWGPARSFRFSMIVAAVMYAGWLLFDRRPFMRANRRNLFMILLALCVTISWIKAPVKDDSVNGKFSEFLKVILVAVFTTGQIDTKDRLRTLIWVIALSFGFYGIKGGIWGIILRDARIIRGPGGLLLDNNDFSLAMVMNIPFLYFLAATEDRPRVRLFLRGAVFLTVITVVLTGSRGGFLAMATVFLALVLKSKYKSIGIAAGIAGSLLFIVLIPKNYKERLLTLKSAAKDDASARGRLEAWSVARRMIMARPFFGVGFQNFVTSYGKYEPYVGAHARHRVTHNSYLQIWAESGTIAFLFFISTLFSTIFLMRRLQRFNRVRDGPAWIGHFASIVEVSLYGFLVGATFLNRAHFDFVYQLCSIGSALHWIAIRELAKDRGTGARTTPSGVVKVVGDPFLVGQPT